MNLHVTKANAFEIDPSKKYLLMVVPPVEWDDKDKKSAGDKLREHFPNMSTVVLNAGSKFKLVEQQNEAKKQPES